MTMIAVEPGGRFTEVPAHVTPAQAPPGAVADGGPGVGLELGAGVLGLEVFARLDAGMRRVADGLDRGNAHRLAVAQAIYPITIDPIPIPASGTLDQRQQLGPTLGRYWDIRLISASGFTPTLPSVSQPAVPATGVAQQNLNTFPVQVVISPNGATITNVSVNGITVGTAAGTYTVPASGSISIAYSVATPTWVWSALGGSAAAIKVWVNSAQGGASRGTITAPDVPLTYGKGQLALRGNGDRLVFTAAGVTGTPIISVQGLHVADGFSGEYFR